MKSEIVGARERFLTTLGLFFCAALFAASPLSPEQERATFQLADTNLVVELVAAEPNVRAPVAIMWDADGKMFVAEMTDYPSGPVSGRIRLLEDRDGDGSYEHAGIFARDIAFPNGVMAWRNGLLVTAAPDIWFLADTNADGRADVREKILTGFAEGNQQLRVNGLFWGLDNWIYGANGRSDGEVKWADGTMAGSIRRHDFRFRPDTKQFEAIAGHSQFGMGYDDWGNRFPVFNNTPIRHVVMEERYALRQPMLAALDVVPSISPAYDGNRVFALSPPALLIPQPVGFFTSACGSSIFRGTLLPESYQGNYFVCEPVQNVVQRRVLVTNGSTFVAEYADASGLHLPVEGRGKPEVIREFLASSDPWFHGVFTATGPDGALHVVDFYREWVEHPHWVAPEVRDKVNWRRGEEHGRIWRIRTKGAKLAPIPKLASAANDELVKSFEHPNGWVRDTAQRLLIERHARAAVPSVERMARDGATPQGRLHALFSLDGLNALSTGVVLTALRDGEARIRERGIELAERLLADGGTAASESRQNIGDRLQSMTDDVDPRVRMQLACTLGQLPKSEPNLDALARLSRHRQLDFWQANAILSSAGERPWLLLSRLGALVDSGIENHLYLLERLTAATVAMNRTNDMTALIDWLKEVRSANRVRIAAALVEALPLNQRPGAVGLLADTALVGFAATACSNESLALPVRLAAVRLLGSTHSISNFTPLILLLDRQQPEPLQVAAAKAVLEGNQTPPRRAAFDRWASCSKAARGQMVASTLRNPGSALALLDALETGQVSLMEIDPATRQALQKSHDPTVKERARKRFASTISSDREAVVLKYKTALQLASDRKRGAAVFERTCVMCHQMQGVGAKVGPDLSGIGTHSRETLLVEILDPSRQVLPDFVSYNATTKGGETYTGFIANESPSTVTLRRANEPDVTLRRDQLTEFTTASKSLMPDGLEAGINEQEMADLLEFLRRPDRTLFTQTK